MTRDIGANKPDYGSILIILAGCFWGSMGVFVRSLGLYGFNSVQIVSIRLILAAIHDRTHGCDIIRYSGLFRAIDRFARDWYDPDPFCGDTFELEEYSPGYCMS